MLKQTLIIITLLQLCASPAAADKPWKGKVVGVADGDTITVLRGGKEQVRIRLDAVDTPEKAQAFGKKAKKFTTRMVAGKMVKVLPKKKDRYGRTVARVTVDGKGLNEALVRAGMAWWYRKYAPGDTVLKKLEAAAREARRGLWRDPKPTPPWQWRRQQRAARGGRHGAPRALWPEGQGEGPLHGNRRSGALHGPRCQYYNCARCTARFKTMAAAKAAGYRPHVACVK